MKRTLITLALCGLCSTAAAEPLSAWNDTAAKHAIEEWVQNATNPDRPTFIPTDKRYVVFDNDGTLWPEAPMTFQIQFALDEIKRLAPENPNWSNDPLVQAVLKDDLKSVVGSGEKGLMHLLSLTHSGMTTEDFTQRVANWVSTHKDPRFGCQYDQMGYQPMRQLLDYLRENGFKTWIVSGGGIDFMRVLSQKMYGIPPEQVIGSFALGEFALSDGDLAMLQYTAANPDAKTFGLLVHHTDAAREYAYDSHPPASGKLVDGLTQAKSHGWTVVDMKQDWKTVFDPAQCVVKSSP